MNDFSIALYVIFPMFIYMAAGFFIRKVGLFSEDSFRQLGVFNFKCFIPLILFYNIYNADLSTIFQQNILLFSVVAVLVIFFVSWALCAQFIKDRCDAASISHCMYHSNYILFGLAIATALYPGNGLATVSALAAILVPLFNILTVIQFSVALRKKLHVGQFIASIFKNTVVDAGIIGVALNLAGIHSLPTILDTPISVLGTMAAPVALLALGGTITFKSIRVHRLHLTTALIVKLVVVPFVGLAAAILCGFRGDLLIVLLALFASPADVSSTPLATEHGANNTLTGEIVASTSLFSLVTIFLFIIVLEQFGFI